MNRKLKMGLIAAAAAAALAGGGAAIAGATGDDRDVERPVQGADLDRASAAALKHAGGGTVTETEAGDEDGAYEVEVTRADGTEVDVHLDESFDVIDSQTERDDDRD